MSARPGAGRVPGRWALVLCVLVLLGSPGSSGGAEDLGPEADSAVAGEDAVPAPPAEEADAKVEDATPADDVPEPDATAGSAAAAAEPESAAAADSERPADQAESAPAVKPYDGLRLGPMTFRGNVNQFYRFRSSEGVTDQDFYGYLGVTGEYTPEREPGKKPSFSKLLLNFQGSYNWDIDSFGKQGIPPDGEYNPFYDVTDTYGNRLHGYLYEFNLEARDLWAFDTVKAGRLTLYREMPVVVDGGYMRTKRWNTIAFEAFGGGTGHIYESSPAGDAIGGAGLESRPLDGLSLGADFMYVRDKREDEPTADDYYYRFYGSYNFLREWTVAASSSWTGSRDRRQSVEVRYLSEAIGLLAQLRGIRQNGIVSFLSSELSPYVLVMGEYDPYYQVQLDLHQPIFDQFGIATGFNLRELEDQSDEGEFNHEFFNLYLAFDTKDLWEGMAFNVRGDMWESDGDDIYGAGCELEQKVWILRIRIGTSYALYEIDQFTGEEKERNRTYYARVRWRLTDHLSLDTDYRFEQDSEADYHVALGGIRIWF